MKHSKKILLIFIALFTVFISGCSMTKAPLSAEDFKTKMENKNYTVGDATSQFVNYSYVKNVYIAQSANQEFQIEFYFLENETNSENFYNNNKSIFEKDTMKSYSETTMLNYNKYTQSSTNDEKKYYSVISTIDNTAVYARVESKYKDAVDEALEEIGY